MPIAFADCELDEQLYQLRRAGRVVKIEPKVFDVLRHLIRERERVVSKHELLDALWPGEAVSESVLPRCIAAARRAVGDDRTRQQLIQTVHGRGYRFVAPLAPPPREVPVAAAPEPTADQGLFVGRDAALRRLTDALDALPRSGGRLLLLVGEPGIGKTRTAEQGAAAARARGLPVSTGRCYEGEGAPAFWPWVQVLRSATAGSSRERLRDDLGPGAADLACLVPELRAHFPELPPAGPIEGQQARFRLFDSVARFLERDAARTPRVIVLDDLHWADADSLLLLQFLAAPLRTASILVIGTYRDVEVRRTHPLRALLASLARESHCERIALRGLAPGEVTALIEGIAGEAPSPRLAESVYEMTEGNPFFVHELVRLLAERDRLGREDANLALSLPQSVRDAIGRRLDSLSPECNELLRVAAFLGREFSSGVLARVTGESAEAVLEGLGEALAAQLLVESDDLGHYAFAHALTRHALQDELRVPQRVALHRRIALALEAAGAEATDAGLAELAHHFFEAAPGGDVQKSIACSVRAAERAHELFAYDESVRHYERALEALELRLPVDEAQRCQLLLALAEERWAAGERDRSRAEFARAADDARRRGDVVALARAAVGMRGYGEMGAAPDAATLALLREALEAVGREHPASRSRVLSRLTGSAPYANSMQTRRELSREAHALAVQSGDRTALADAIAARYWASLGPDGVDERRAVGREALELGQKWGDPRLCVLGHEAQIGAQLLQGELAEAERSIGRYESLASELRQPLFLFLAHLLRGSHAMNIGRFTQAESLFARAAEIGRGAVPYADALHAGTIFWLHSLRGDPQPFDGLEQMLREIFDAEDASSRALLRAGLAYSRLVSGDVEAARREHEELRRMDLRALERDEHWLMTMESLSGVVRAFGDAETAQLLYELLLPYRHLMVMHDLLRAVPGTVASALGTLAFTAGRLDEAEVLLNEGIAREQALGLQPALCGSRAALAGLLLTRGRPGDRPRADALLAAAERTAREIGSHRSYLHGLPKA